MATVLGVDGLQVRAVAVQRNSRISLKSSYMTYPSQCHLFGNSIFHNPSAKWHGPYGQEYIMTLHHTAFWLPCTIIFLLHSNTLVASAR